MIPQRIIGPVTQVDVLRFAGASGDFNPLHHDVQAARRAGFPAPVVMGQMTAGMLAAWLADWCGVEHLQDLTVRFVAPVLVGDTVTLEGNVVGPIDPSGRAELEIKASTAGRVAVVGQAHVRLRDAGRGDQDLAGAPTGGTPS
jgi:acyl dehydratase